MATKICVVGLGYVGLPLAIEFSQYYSVIGFDVNEQRISQLKRNLDSSEEIEEEKLAQSQVLFTNQPEKIREANFIVICVPTPVDKVKQPDFGFLQSASEVVGQNLSEGAVVVYESTVYPGCTEEVCVPILEKCSRLKCGEQFKVGYSPERINPGDKEHSLSKVVKIVSGMDLETLEKVASVYSKVARAGVHKAPNIKTAEAAKVIENIQRDLNIALINELDIIFDKIGVKTKEVLEAAGTKWNWHKYHPGLVGGHCLEYNSKIFIKERGRLKIISIGEYLNSLRIKPKIIRGTQLFHPPNTSVLSFDVAINKAVFKPLILASKRKNKCLIKLNCAYNYNLEVTNKHPILIYDKGIKTKLAEEIKIGDQLLLNKFLPSQKGKVIIDFLKYLSPDQFSKIRVKFKNRKISDFRRLINSELKVKKGNFYCWDYLPLDKYLFLEKKLRIRRKDIYLCTGRGPGLKKIPCLFNLDLDFARLIGYYLSEGCITKDRSLRTRFTFNRKEKEYIKDLTSILKRKQIDYSLYQDKNYQSTVIKVSSNLFGFLIKEILGCGTNCYNMIVPDLMFNSNRKIRAEILKGLFRGGGGVSWSEGKRHYQKKGKVFFHHSNCLTVSYFTSSEVLFQQVCLLLLDQGTLPKLSKRKGYLTISSIKSFHKFKTWFLGEKKKKIEQYLLNLRKEIVYQKSKGYPTFITLAVEGTERKKTDFVYSLEVKDTNTFITSYGLIVHNCIAIDPYYLTYKAEELGYHPEVILAGRRINDNMHKFYVEKIIKKFSSLLPNRRILVLGLTFKPNVSDYRNSGVKLLIKELQDYHFQVSAYDPYLSKEVTENRFHAQYWNPSEQKLDFDLVLLAVEHHKLKGLLDTEIFSGKTVLYLSDL